MSKSNDSNKKDRELNSGFRLEVFNFIIIILTVAITVLLSVVIFMARSTYDAFYDAAEEYITCRQSADEIHEASDYLTSKVKSYVSTGKKHYMDDYFYEALVDKRRERALAAISVYDTSSDKNTYLENAVAYSKELMEMEYYAMRLIAEATSLQETDYPEEIKNVEVKLEDQIKTPAGKVSVAAEMVSGGEYTDYKEKIYNNVNLYTRGLIKETRQRERENSVKFAFYQGLEIILIIVLIGILMLTVAFTTIFLIRPLRQNSKLIISQNLLPVKGPKEMRVFAALYNKAVEKTIAQHKKLSYDSSHDSLTGIRNRRVFDEMYRSVDDTENTALLIVDIDNFKEINDTFGHMAGDAVLKKVGSLLQTSFRSDDIISRIGGDEFVAVVCGVSPEYKEQLENKVRAIMQKCGMPEGTLPSFTVSVGIAFGGENITFKEMYNKADKALYSVKTTTKNDLNFYREV